MQFRSWSEIHEDRSQMHEVVFDHFLYFLCDSIKLTVLEIKVFAELMMDDGTSARAWRATRSHILIK